MIVIVFYLDILKCKPRCLDSAYHSSLTWPTIRGFFRSVMSYCRMSPCNQLLKYRKRSSNAIKMSVIRPMGTDIRNLVTLKKVKLHLTFATVTTKLQKTIWHELFWCNSFFIFIAYQLWCHKAVNMQWIHGVGLKRNKNNATLCITCLKYN